MGEILERKGEAPECGEGEGYQAVLWFLGLLRVRSLTLHGGCFGWDQPILSQVGCENFASDFHESSLAPIQQACQ